MNTMESWGVMDNDAFFLGGVETRTALGVLRPRIFFGEQSGNCVRHQEYQCLKFPVRPVLLSAG